MIDYKGVSWNRQKQRWVSTVSEKGVLYNCGFYLDQKEAVLARDMCVINNGLSNSKLQILKPNKYVDTTKLTVESFMNLN